MTRAVALGGGVASTDHYVRADMESKHSFWLDALADLNRRPVSHAVVTRELAGARRRVPGGWLAPTVFGAIRAASEMAGAMEYFMSLRCLEDPMRLAFMEKFLLDYAIVAVGNTIALQAFVRLTRRTTDEIIARARPPLWG